MKGDSKMGKLILKGKQESKRLPLKGKGESIQETIKPESKPLNRMERERLEYIETYFYNILQTMIDKGILNNQEVSECIPGVISKKKGF